MFILTILTELIYTILFMSAENSQDLITLVILL